MFESQKMLKNFTNRELFIRISDYGFLLCFPLLALMGAKVVGILALFTIGPLIFFWDFKKIKSRVSRIRPSIFSLFFYSMYGLVSLYIHRGAPQDMSLSSSSDIKLILGGLVIFVLCSLRASLIDGLAQKMGNFFPMALTLVFLVLAAWPIFFHVGDVCRITAATPLPFIPALTYSTIAIIGLASWQGLGSGARFLQMLTLSLSEVVVTSITGSRGITLGLLLVLMVILLISFSAQFRSAMPRPRHLIYFLLAGLVASVSYAALTGCLFEKDRRFAAALEAIPNLVKIERINVLGRIGPVGSSTEIKSEKMKSPSQVIENINSKYSKVTSDSSIAQRLALWRVGLKAAQARPLWGYGMLSMKMIIMKNFYPFEFAHFHNQFLSWQIMGGVFYLIIGILALLTPVLSLASVSGGGKIVLWCALPVQWGIYMMVDAPFQINTFFHFYCAISALVCIGFVGRD